MAALGDAFAELKRRAENVGMSEEEYLAQLLAHESAAEREWGIPEWKRILEPAERDIAEGRVIDGKVARERMETYMRDQRKK